MIIIVGLGNPGTHYQHTRHNAGFMVVDQLATTLSFPQFSIKPKLQAEISKRGDVVLVKPTTFMNASGEAVRAVIEYYTDWQLTESPLIELYVVHDDLDLPLGNHKLQFGTGPKLHNGLVSIDQHLGTNQYWHVRIGVDARAGERNIPPEKYVVQPFPDSQHQLLTKVIKEVVMVLQDATT